MQALLDKSKCSRLERVVIEHRKLSTPSSNAGSLKDLDRFKYLSLTKLRIAFEIFLRKNDLDDRFKYSSLVREPKNSASRDHSRYELYDRFKYCSSGRAPKASGSPPISMQYDRFK
jgi:hypothetical protein